MEKISKAKIAVAFTINICITVMEVIASIIGGVLHLKDYGLKIFIFYTQDSNLFLFVTCVIMTIMQAQILWGKRKGVPLWAQRLKYMATCGVSLTFLVVIFILIPLAGMDSIVDKLFTEAKLYHHFLCPILAFLSFVVLEKQPEIHFIDTLYALIPTAIYAIIMTIFNITHVVEGPYPFFKVYEQGVLMSCVWCTTILVTAYGIAVGVYYLNKIKKKETI